MRGTFANVRLKNLLAPGTEGGVTRHLPDGAADVDLRRLGEVRGGRRAAGDPGRQGIRLRLIARLGRQGAEAARRPRRDRRELRAHPSQQPGRHGHAAAAVQHGRERREPGPDAARKSTTSRACPRCWPRIAGEPGDHGARRRRPDGTSKTFQAVVRIDTPQEVRTTSTAASCSMCCGNCWGDKVSPWLRHLV